MRRGKLTRQEILRNMLRTVKADEANNNDDGGANNNASDDKNKKDVNVSVLIENARTEERNKLHKTIDTLKNSVATHEATSKDLAQQLSTAQSTITELQGKLKDMEALSNSDVDERIKTSNKTISENEEKIKNLEAEILTWKSKHATLELQQAKEALIRGAEGKLIEEMVTGSTVEELEASLEVAKKAYAKYVKVDTSNKEEDSKGDSLNKGATSSKRVTNPRNNQTEKLMTELQSLNPLGNKADRARYAEIRKQLG